jgi:TRAP-type mannitol/chloroaromatic compound transport system permease large subunit
MMGVIPYVLVMLAMVALLVAVPGIALFFKPV